MKSNNSVRADGLRAPSSRHQIWGQAAPTAPFGFPNLWKITAYMRLLLRYIAIGQLRHCVSRCHFLAGPDSSSCGGSNTLRAPPPTKSWRGSRPLAPPGFRATGHGLWCIHQGSVAQLVNRNLLLSYLLFSIFIWFFADVPHVLKNLRNHVLDDGLYLPKEPGSLERVIVLDKPMLLR